LQRDKRSHRRSATALSVQPDEYNECNAALSETAEGARKAAAGSRPPQPERSATGSAKWGVKTLFIEPGSPWENGYCESFNSKLRDELLNGEIFTTFYEARC
jgi:transposase InsO family protein